MNEFNVITITLSDDDDDYQHYEEQKLGGEKDMIIIKTFSIKLHLIRLFEKENRNETKNKLFVLILDSEDHPSGGGVRVSKLCTGVMSVVALINKSY